MSYSTHLHLTGYEYHAQRRLKSVFIVYLTLPNPHSCWDNSSTSPQSFFLRAPSEEVWVRWIVLTAEVHSQLLLTLSNTGTLSLMLPGSIRLLHFNSPTRSSPFVSPLSWQIKAPWYKHSSTRSYEHHQSYHNHIPLRLHLCEDKASHKWDEQGSREEEMSYYNTLLICNIWSITYELGQKTSKRAVTVAALAWSQCQTPVSTVCHKLQQYYTLLKWSSRKAALRAITFQISFLNQICMLCVKTAFFEQHYRLYLEWGNF